MNTDEYVADYAVHHATAPWLRWALWVIGVLSLVTGAIGVIVPGLPTTPFVLLAAACFIRASPRAHAWLLRDKTFGPLVREWEQHRSVPRRTKRIALGMMLVTGGVSLWFLADRPGIQLAVSIGIAIGAFMVLRLPTRP